MEYTKASFTAEDDDGRLYTIQMKVEVRREATLDGTSELHEGLPHFILDNGYNVNHVAKGEYLVVQTQTRLRSDDPNAP